MYKTQSGYHNTMFYLFKLLNKLFPEVISAGIPFTNGAEGFKVTKSVHFIHRKEEFNPNAIINLSNVDFGVDSFILPPKIDRLEVPKGDKVVIPDFSKNPDLGLEIINKNPNVQFRILISHRHDPQVKYNLPNVEVMRDETFTSRIFSNTRLAIFVSNAHYETFGIFPLEALACGIPTIVSDRYNQPFIKKTKLSTKRQWTNFDKNQNINGNGEFSLYEAYQMSQFGKFKDLMLKHITST